LAKGKKKLNPREAEGWVVLYIKPGKIEKQKMGTMDHGDKGEVKLPVETKIPKSMKTARGRQTFTIFK